MKKKKNSNGPVMLTAQDKTILTVGYVLLGLFVAAIILPVVYIILASFIDPVM